MHFLIHLTIVLLSLIAIVFSCVLFTNAIEFLGNKLKLGNNATGSILAVIGTGLPELIVPIVAICGVHFSDIKINIAQDIALGAILGSPFMLSTLALLFLSAVLIIKKRKELNVDYEIILRDYKYFLLAYAISILFSFNFLNQFKIIGVILLLFLYTVFVLRTILKSRLACTECECEDLYFSKLKLNSSFILVIQLILSLFLLILSSHYFVNEIKYFSNVLNVSPAFLALLITPFATELPECINSIIWLKQDKDNLAIANILGAIVFQSTLLFSIGLLLTPWIFDKTLYFNIALTFANSILFTFFIIKNKKITYSNLLICGIVYFFYLFYIFIIK